MSLMDSVSDYKYEKKTKLDTDELAIMWCWANIKNKPPISLSSMLKFCKYVWNEMKTI